MAFLYLLGSFDQVIIAEKGTVRPCLCFLAPSQIRLSVMLPILDRYPDQVAAQT